MKDINPNNPREYLALENIYAGAKSEEIIQSKPQNLTDKDIKHFKIHCLKYYTELANQIQKRFLNIDQYKNVLLLNPKRVLHEPGNVVPLLTQFPNLCTDLERTAALYRQICNLDNLVKQLLVKADFESIWFQLYELKNSDFDLCFEFICSFAFKIMSLSHSNAATERIFSQLNLIKTKTRNRLLSETTNSLIMAKEFVKYNGEKC